MCCAVVQSVSPAGLLLCTLFADRQLWSADKREFIKISQAVGVGFVVMGAIGYLVKLGRTHHMPKTRTKLTFLIVHIPVNNILVA